MIGRLSEGQTYAVLPAGTATVPVIPVVFAISPHGKLSRCMRQASKKSKSFLTWSSDLVVLVVGAIMNDLVLIREEVVEN